MTADVHTLTGAYALDALPPDERAFFERHMAACEACRAEVDELTRTSAHLATLAHEAPPASLRTAVMAAVDVTRQSPPLAPPVAVTRISQLQRLAVPIAACLALAVGALSTATWQLQHRLDTVEQGLVFAAPDVRTVDLTGPGGSVAQLSFSEDQDRAILVVEDLPELPDSQQYEVWLFHGGTPVPTALFSTADDGRAIAHVQDQVAGASQVAVTIEPRGGVAAPTGTVVASAAM